MKTYILDACAIIALLKEESGFEKVAELYEDVINDKINLFVNIINLFEVYYNIFRDYDPNYADKVLNEIQKLSITIVDKFDDIILKKAAYLKASYKISLADSIAVATAIRYKGILVTADHHELDIVEKNNEAEFLWIR